MENWKRQIYSSVDQPEIDAHFVIAVTHDGKRCLSAKKLGADLATAIAQEITSVPDGWKVYERMMATMKKAKEIAVQILLERGRKRLGRGGNLYDKKCPH